MAQKKINRLFQVRLHYIDNANGRTDWTILTVVAHNDMDAREKALDFIDPEAVMLLEEPEFVFAEVDYKMEIDIL